MHLLRLLTGHLATFGRARKGGVAIIFAIITPLLVGVIFGAIDFSRVMSSRAILQDSLDAATLYAARSTATTDPQAQAFGERALNANLLNMTDGVLTGSSFTLANNGQTVVATAQGSITTTIMGLLGVRTLTFGAASQVVRASKNLEVALVLDTTGSMAGQNIADMKQAASDLIDVVVKDTQTPFYSKVALVPYAQAVNPGSYANAVRGALTATKTITNATKANPVVITSNGHGFVNGDKVYITGVNGMTQINNKLFTVAGKNNNSFQLSGVDGRYYNSYSSSGAISCTNQGCPYYRFDNPYGDEQVFQAQACATERTGTNAYTEVAPSTTLLGRNYRPPSSPCLSNTITPLSSDKTALKNSLSVLTASGSTGGQIGIAWGWYMLSPNFAYLWPGTTAGAAYTTPDLIKAVVLMTDGEYNSVYCNGVISRDSTSGSGSVAEHESCNSPNGSSYTQGGQLCTNMKNAGVIVYVVGFQVVNTQAARDLVNNCASDAAHVYLPANGTDLKTAFQAIGADLSKLRISQ